MSSDIQRKLTTILAADAEGYSRAMVEDEVGALAALRRARTVFAKFIERHHGRIANTAGDGLIADFPSVVEAVQCAIEVQNELGDASVGPEAALNFRIGIHLGDVLIDGEDLLGEGVNLAARLQTLAEPGGIVISQQVYDQVRAKLSVGFDYLGQRRPKNFSEDIAIYRVSRTAARLPLASHGRRTGAADGRERSGANLSETRSEVRRSARILGLVWAGLLVVDLVTGQTFWAHWPGLGILAYLGWRAAPIFVRPGLGLGFVRTIAAVGVLIAVNIFTWSGIFWAAWPTAALIAFYLYRRSRLRSG